MIDRAVTDGLVKRTPDTATRSVVRVTLTQAGLEKLDALAAIHLRELNDLAPSLRLLWQALEAADGDTGVDVGLVW